MAREASQRSLSTPPRILVLIRRIISPEWIPPLEDARIKAILQLSFRKTALVVLGFGLVGGRAQVPLSSPPLVADFELVRSLGREEGAPGRRQFLNS